MEKVSGESYITGPSCKTLYATTGSSTDYMGDVAGAKFALTIELPPSRENLWTGFMLPAEEILPTCKEQWAGISYMLKALE